MPEYTVYHPRTGRTLVIRGERPPTEDDLRRIFAATGPGAATPQPLGSATGRFLSNAGEMLNPVTMVTGLYGTVRHPVDTAMNIARAQGEQFGKARTALEEGRYLEAAKHGYGAAVPILGPLVVEANEQIGSGDVAGGLGKAAGIFAPFAGARPLVRGARAAVPSGVRARVAGALERGATSRVADVMAPKVGPNKVRFGNQAEKVAPQIAKDLATEGAPLTREGLHAQVGTKLAEAEAALDAAADARLAARTFETKPMVDALLEKRRALTSEAVEGSRPMRAAEGPGRLSAVPLGKDVVPGPNSARVAIIDQAISELQTLGPVTRYDPIRTMRQAYDGPAKAVYSPSMTADYMKAQGGKLGAADVTGTLRETLAQWDPQTATANAGYSLYRSADDVMQAAAEVERVRPRVGRQIMARLTGTIFGQQAAGVPGAVAGYIGAPVVDAALSAGFTTQLKTARAMQRLADAVRSGSMERVNGSLALLQRELKTTIPVQISRLATDQNQSQSTTRPVP